MMGKPGSAQDDRTGTRGGYSNGLLDGEARKAMNAAFEAMSEWRDDMSATAERHTAKVFDKMGAAAKAAGWPDQLVDSTRANMQQMSKMQMQMMDRVMDAWTEQMKSPGKFTLGNAVAGGMPGMPTGQGGMGFGQNMMPNFGQNFGAFPGMPQMDMSKFGFGTNPMAPFQFWMEATQLWQKQWADALSSMVNGMPGLPGMMGGNMASGQQDAPSPRKPTTIR